MRSASRWATASCWRARTTAAARPGGGQRAGRCPDQGRTLVITLGLAGQSGFVARTGAALRFGAGQTTLAAFRGSQGERRYAAGQTVRQLRLLLSGAALDRYLGPSFRGG